MAMKANPVSAVLKIVLDKVKFLLVHLFVNYHPVFVHVVVFVTVNRFVLYELVLVAAQLKEKPTTVKPLLSGPPIKWTPSIKQTLSRVLKLTSYISVYNEPLFSRHLC